MVWASALRSDNGKGETALLLHAFRVCCQADDWDWVEVLSIGDGRMEQPSFINRGAAKASAESGLKVMK